MAKNKNLRFGVGANLAGKRKPARKSRLRGGDKREARRREYELYKAKLPKEWWKRVLRWLSPVVWFRYLKTSIGRRKVLVTILVIFVALLIVAAVRVAVIWRDIEEKLAVGIDVEGTTNIYYDRNCLTDDERLDESLENCTVLWEDKGTGNYRLVVDSHEISPLAKMATVAIEDHNFYSHGGVDLFGIMRAAFVSVFGGQLQGASTLTQQLVKQVYLVDGEGVAARSGWAGIDRKFQEIVMATILEGKYSKDQILAMYMNYSPYGGRRNGIESAAQTYFGKRANDIDISQAALLASIPQNPSYFNPYSMVEWCTDSIPIIDEETGDTIGMRSQFDCTLVENSLMRRQRTTLSYMAEQCDNIKRAGAAKDDLSYEDIDCNEVKTKVAELNEKFDEFKKDSEGATAETNNSINILGTIRPLSDQMEGVLAPHFVLMAKAQLESELGRTIVGRGGLRIVTTLDHRAQKTVEEEVYSIFSDGFANKVGADNAAATLIDAPTGQILALQGSRDYNYPGYGSVNSAMAYLQPGSSIKPTVYAALIEKREDPTYGAGSLLDDTPIPQCYAGVTGICYSTASGQTVQNATGTFSGIRPIRNLLPESRNIPAIRAMALTGYDEDGKPKAWKTIHAMGEHNYCTDPGDIYAGLSSAIGSCGVLQVEHANAFATLARMGEYRSYTAIIKVESARSEPVYWWEDWQKREQAIDPQTAYILSDVLSDPNARAGIFGYCPAGFCINRVKTATKTGTTDTGTGRPKEFWMQSYSPKASLSLWVGNHVPAALRGGDSMELGPYVRDIMSTIHLNIFQPEGTWREGDWFTRPDGIQDLEINGRKDIYPSWFNKDQQMSSVVTMTFDIISKKLATECTPPAARVEQSVIKYYDPATKKTTYKVEGDWNPNENSDTHSCASDAAPSVYVDGVGFDSVRKQLSLNVVPGNSSASITEVVIFFNGEAYAVNNYTPNVGNSRVYTVKVPDGYTGDVTVKATVKDSLLYESTSATITINIGTTTTTPPSSGG